MQCSDGLLHSSIGQVGQREGEEDGEDAEGDAVTQLPLGRVRIAETEIGEGQIVRGLVISDPFVQLCKLKRPLSCFIIVLDLLCIALTYLTVSAVSMFSDSSIRFSYLLSLGKFSAIQAFCSMNLKNERLKIHTIKMIGIYW